MIALIDPTPAAELLAEPKKNARSCGRATRTRSSKKSATDVLETTEMTLSARNKISKSKSKHSGLQKGAPKKARAVTATAGSD
jgi:hypothetical protein